MIKILTVCAFCCSKCGEKLSVVQEMTANLQLSNSHSSVSLDNDSDELPQDAARLEAVSYTHLVV